MMRPRDKASVWLLESVWPCPEFGCLEQRGEDASEVGVLPQGWNSFP